MHVCVYICGVCVNVRYYLKVLVDVLVKLSLHFVVAAVDIEQDPNWSLQQTQQLPTANCWIPCDSRSLQRGAKHAMKHTEQSKVRGEIIGKKGGSGHVVYMQ